MKAPTIIKVSGHHLTDEDYLREFANFVASMDDSKIIVHGGGKEITELQNKLNIQPKYVEGLRVTDPDSLALVEMVMCGTVNKRVVRHLLNAGLEAMGLSGVDRQMVTAKPLENMGATGIVENVNLAPILELLEKNILPVISPVSYYEYHNLNVNADHVTAAIASEIQAKRVIFLSNVEAVLYNGKPINHLSVQQAEEWIATGVISGGMIPKVRMALDILAKGVHEAVITSLDGLQTHGGTVFTQKQNAIDVVGKDT